MKVERLDAADETGAATQVLRVTPRIRAPTLTGEATLDGRPAFKTLDGEHLNHVDGELVGIHSGRRFTLT